MATQLKVTYEAYAKVFKKHNCRLDDSMLEVMESYYNEGVNDVLKIISRIEVMKERENLGLILDSHTTKLDEVEKIIGGRERDEVFSDMIKISNESFECGFLNGFKMMMDIVSGVE